MLRYPFALKGRTICSMGAARSRVDATGALILLDNVSKIRHSSS